MLTPTMMQQCYAMQEYRRQMLLRAYAYQMAKSQYAPNSPAGSSDQSENRKDQIVKVPQNVVIDSALQVKEIQKVFPNPIVDVDDASTIDDIISCYNTLKSDSSKSDFTTHGDFIDTMSAWIDQKNEMP